VQNVGCDKSPGARRQGKRPRNLFGLRISLDDLVQHLAFSRSLSAMAGTLVPTRGGSHQATARVPLSTRAAAAAPCKQFPLVLAGISQQKCGCSKPRLYEAKIGGVSAPRIPDVRKLWAPLSLGCCGFLLLPERPRLRYALTIDALVQRDRAFRRPVIQRNPSAAFR